VATAQKYQEASQDGHDEFGRPSSEMAPLNQPPFYVMELWPVLLNTQGGPRRNEKSQVVDVFGKVIPRLYAAGELGSVFGMLYPGAGNVSECFVFGKIAGRNAAEELPL
jgi:succinate dehydrogenase/fumarate reductase flavoprotein subunit